MEMLECNNRKMKAERKIEVLIEDLYDESI